MVISAQIYHKDQLWTGPWPVWNLIEPKYKSTFLCRLNNLLPFCPHSMALLLKCTSALFSSFPSIIFSDFPVRRLTHFTIAVYGKGTSAEWSGYAVGNHTKKSFRVAFWFVKLLQETYQTFSMAVLFLFFSTDPLERDPWGSWMSHYRKNTFGLNKI